MGFFNRRYCIAKQIDNIETEILDMQILLFCLIGQCSWYVYLLLRYSHTSVSNCWVPASPLQTRRSVWSQERRVSAEVNKGGCYNVEYKHTMASSQHGPNITSTVNLDHPFHLLRTNEPRKPKYEILTAISFKNVIMPFKIQAAFLCQNYLDSILGCYVFHIVSTYVWNLVLILLKIKFIADCI